MTTRLLLTGCGRRRWRLCGGHRRRDGATDGCCLLACQIHESRAERRQLQAMQERSRGDADDVQTHGEAFFDTTPSTFA